MSAPGVVSPDSFPVRDPRDKSMTNGRVVNPPRFYEAGGASSQAIWFKEGGNHAEAQMEQKNVAKVEKPTSVKVAHKSSHEND